MTALLVTGSRDWIKRDILFKALDEIHDLYGIDRLIEGCYRGADNLAEIWFRDKFGREPEHYPANWDEFGKGAGPRRNSQMLRDGLPDIAVAFHPRVNEDDFDGGTADMVYKLDKVGIPCFRITGNEDNWKPDKVLTVPFTITGKDLSETSPQMVEYVIRIEAEAIEGFRAALAGDHNRLHQANATTPAWCGKIHPLLRSGR